MDRIGRSWLLASAGPPAVLVVLVACCAVNVPYWDQWDLLPDVAAAQQGDLDLGSLWRQHSSHRIPLPRLLIIGLSLASGWDVRVEMAMEIVLAAGLWALLLVLARITLGGTAVERRLGPVAVLLSLLVFNPNQWEAWTWGIQLVAFLNVLGVVFATWALARPPISVRHLGLAAGGCLVATLSFSSGLLSWIALAPLVASSGGRRWVRLAAWCGIASTTWVVYLVGYQGPQGGLADVLRTPRLLLYYLLAYVGSPVLGWQGRWSIPAGGLLLVALAVVVLALWHRGSPARHVPELAWLGLAGYVMLTACVTAVGRLGDGVGQALSSRYITSTNLLWATVVVLVARLLPPSDDPTAAAVRRALGAGVALLLVAAGFAGAARMLESASVRRDAARRLAAGAPASELTMLYPHPDHLAERIELLRQSRLSLFRHPPAPPGASSRKAAQPSPAGSPPADRR